MPNFRLLILAIFASAVTAATVPARAAPLEGPPMTVEVCHTFAS
ncbi:MAG: hypothetical protein RIQ46_1859, partial [Pseudomonadota bacterium]